MEQDFNSKLDSLLTGNRLPFLTSHEEAKKRVMGRITKTENVIPLRRSNRIFSKLAIAASIAVLFVVSLTFFGAEKIENSSSSVLSHTLPDGSIIFLGPAAEVKYNDLTWIFSRNLDFSGAAFFEVKKGSRFNISADMGSVSVLGTSFAVITKKERLRVSCKTGKVRVEDGKSFSTILTPGQGVEVGESAAEDFSINTEYIDAWVEGTYQFDNVSVDEVLNSLEDFTTYKVEYPEGLNASYSGEFSTDQSVEEILDIVCKPMGLSYEINEEKSLIRITNK